MSKLTEALVSHDLDYLVMPLLDIDTFESKIDDNRAVVVAFYVVEQEPAKDLERFIEKGAIQVMDIESSPAPTDDGYYVVFVELDRNDKLPEAIMHIIDDVNNLTNNDKWQFKTVGSNEIQDLNKENLQQYVNLVPEEESNDEHSEDGELKENVAAFLINGLMESIEIADRKLILSSPGVRLEYKVVQEGTHPVSMPILALPIGHPLLSQSQQLGRTLGAYYSVELVEEGLLVQNENGYMILEPID